MVRSTDLLLCSHSRPEAVNGYEVVSSNGSSLSQQQSGDKANKQPCGVAEGPCRGNIMEGGTPISRLVQSTDVESMTIILPGDKGQYHENCGDFDSGVGVGAMRWG